MEKYRITGIICKGTKIRLNGICFHSYLLLQIPHWSTLQFYLNLSFCQLFISLDIAANVDIILKCHWFCKLKTRRRITKGILSFSSFKLRFQCPFLIARFWRDPVTPLFFAIETLTLLAFAAFIFSPFLVWFVISRSNQLNKYFDCLLTYSPQE